MFNIMRRNNNDRPTPPAAPEWEPVRMMRDLFQWDPFREMAPLATREFGFDPDFDVKETKDGYVFTADMPGIKLADLDIALYGNRLTVSGKRESEQRDEKDRYYTYERSYGAFTRSFTLPEGIDSEHASADLKDGVLVIAVPKKAEAQPKKITVRADEKKA